MATIARALSAATVARTSLPWRRAVLNRRRVEWRDRAGRVSAQPGGRCGLFSVVAGPHHHSRAPAATSVQTLPPRRSTRGRPCTTHHAHTKSATSIEDAMQNAARVLERALVPEARLSAEHLMAAALHRHHPELVRRPQRADLLDALRRQGASSYCLSPEAAGDFASMWAERLKRRPVQYILGEWDFTDFTLAVREPVLIPRPETEQLVEHVVAAASRQDERASEQALVPGRGFRFVDVGCGSGAISLALLRQIPDSSGVAIDVNATAVELTVENAKRLGVAHRLQVRLQDVAELGSADGPDNVDFDCLVSNPPYIPSRDMRELEAEIAEYEDHRALDGGNDGLDIVRQVLHAATRVVRPGGLVWMEVDTSHPPLMAELAAAAEYRHAGGFMLPPRVFDDLAGRPRFVEVRRRVTL